jgi:hypothetical protein
VPLLRKALFPLRSGRFTVEPAVVDLTVQHYDRRLFFAPPVARSEQLRLRTEGQRIDVRPLPPAPPGFGGAVGRLALETELQPRQIHLGEAATLTVRLSGTGNLQGIREPRISPPAGLTVFPPQQEGRDEVSGTTVRGSRVWRYVVVADRVGRYRLQSPEIPYFDPESGHYRLAAAPALGLQALPRPAETAAASGAAHAIRSAALQAGGSSRRRWASALPWLFAIPWAVALAVTLARRRAYSAAAASPLPAGSTAGRRFADGLRQAEREERPRQVAARIEEAWRGLLAERWDIQAEVPPSRWRELLAARGANPEALEEMGRLVEDLQYLRNAPQLSAIDSVRRETLRRCRFLQRRLR